MPTMMNCREFLDGLESWMEGERPAAAEVHFRDCTACRGMIEDMGAISATAAEWRDRQPEPSPHIWLALRSQLEAEGVIRPQPAPVAREAKSRWGLWWGFPRLAMAGASLAVIVAVGLGASGPIQRRVNDHSWMRRTQNSTRPLDAELARVETRTVAAFGAQDPLVTASMHHSLAVVDNYITLCEKDVREEPQSELARDYLYGAYQQKAELLADMADRGVDNR